MADNVLPQFNRNYGAMVTAKEFWGGNNGFVTIALQLPAGYELAAGPDFVPTAGGKTNLADFIKENTATDAQLIRHSNAQRNLFRVAQALSQRAVLVAISGTEKDEASTDALDNLVTGGVGGNILAVGKAGADTTVKASATPIYYVTFMIERADALNAQVAKPGSNPPLSVDPCAELMTMLLSSDMFESDTFTQDPDGRKVSGDRHGAVGAAVKVFDALPVLKK